MTFIFAFLAAHIGAIAAIGGAAALAIGSWFHGNKSGKAALQPQVDAAKQTAAAALSQAAQASANAAASAQATQAVVNKDQAVQDASGKSDAQLRSDMNDEFGAKS